MGKRYEKIDIDTFGVFGSFYLYPCAGKGGRRPTGNTCGICPL